MTTATSGVADDDPELIPAPPEGTKAGGRELWDEVVAHWTLSPLELRVLGEIVRSADLLDDLAEIIRRDGPVIDSPQGRKAHPAVAEARQQKIVLARLVSALRIPLDTDDDGRRSQNRPGQRGFYDMGGS